MKIIPVLYASTDCATKVCSSDCCRLQTRSMNIYEFTNYRDFLKAALGERMDANPQYSLRAMARDCGLGSSTIWGAMSGRTNLSIEAGVKIAQALKLKSKEKTFLCDLVQLESQKDPTLRSEILERLRRAHPKKRIVSDLTVEQFKQIADWYHSAILELPLIEAFIISGKNVANALSIPLPIAELAIERLIKLGFLKQDENGVIERVASDLRVQSDIRNAALRQFYRQMLEKASRSLETQTPQERLSGYLTLPISKEVLPEVDDAISRFFGELKIISEKNKNRTEVYHLSMHFFNLTKKEK